MKIFKTSFLSLLFFCVCVMMTKGVAQNVDSIFLKYTDKKGKVNLDSVLKVGRDILYTQPAKTFEIAHKSILLAEKQKEPLQLAASFRQLSAYFIDIKSNYDSATYYLQQAEPLFRANRSDAGINGLGAVLNNYANIHLLQNNYPEALDLYLQALKLFDKTGETDTRAKILNNISFLYAFFKDYQKSERYARESIEFARKSNNELIAIVATVALIDALIHQDKLDGVPALLEEVKSYAEKKKDNNRILTYNYNYGSYYSKKEEYASALEHYKTARDLADSIGNEWEIMRTGIGLAGILLSNKQYNEALDFATPSLKIAEKFEMMDMRQRTLNIMSIANAELGNYETAFRQSRLAYLLKDTVLNESNRQHLSLLEVEYETEKKELRITSLEKERILYGVIFGVSLLGIIILLGALYLRQRAKKQLAQQQVIQLEKEKQLIATHAILEGEATERTRLARDLHDGLGGMLSAVKLNLFDMQKGGALLASEDVIQFNKVVDMLDSSITELRRVAHNMMPDSLSRYGLKVSLQDFCDSLPNVNFHFFGDDERIENTLEIMIYRSVHELVNNALKYAEAKNINVQIVQQPDRVSLTVQDDGKGFDTTFETKGTGLNNIRTRAESVGGTMNVFSQPRKGTEVNVEFKV